MPLTESGFGEVLEARVTDSGIGIPPGALEQLFRPFSQIDSSLARKFEGTGLDWLMVKLLAGVARRVGGRESAVGKGSCFTVWLPLRRRKTGRARPPPRRPSRRPPPASRRLAAHAPRWSSRTTASRRS